MRYDQTIGNYPIFRLVMPDFRVDSYVLLPRLPWSFLAMLERPADFRGFYADFRGMLPKTATADFRGFYADNAEENSFCVILRFILRCSAVSIELTFCVGLCLVCVGLRVVPNTVRNDHSTCMPYPRRQRSS